MDVWNSKAVVVLTNLVSQGTGMAPKKSTMKQSGSVREGEIGRWSL